MSQSLKLFQVYHFFSTYITSFIICCADEEEARRTIPGEGTTFAGEMHRYLPCENLRWGEDNRLKIQRSLEGPWENHDECVDGERWWPDELGDVFVNCLGTAAPSTDPGIICIVRH